MEDDGLDDLDDILDEFQPQPQPQQVARSQPGEAGEGQRLLPDVEEDFASQLQAGMKDLMKELEKSPEQRDQFEGLVQEMSNATASAGTGKGTGTEPRTFQDTVTETMERMKTSGREADAAQSASSDSNDFLSEMLKQVESAAGGEGGDADFSGMLMGMMEQLTSKEVLYEPMKDLDDRFPDYLRTHNLSPEERTKYTEQQRYVREIIAKFDAPCYDDGDETCKAYIVERMQKMQELGSPPAEMMSELANGLDLDGNGMPKLPEDACPVS